MAEAQPQGNPFGILSYQKAVPSADDLLSLKLLAETDGEFNFLKEEATLYLKNAMRMLSASPFLRTKFGGDGIKPASVLAELLKQRADTLNFQSHIDDMAKQLLNKEYSKINMTGLKPKIVPVYNRRGDRIQNPVNMLGQRFAYDNGGHRINNGRIVGGIDINAFGGLWRNDANVDDTFINNYDDFQDRAALRASSRYVRG